MSEDKPQAGNLSNVQGRYAIVASRFNALVVDKLVAGALGCLQAHGISEGDVSVLRVPGAFELPQAAKRLALTGRFDAVITLGVVIRGRTPHFDYVCQACTQGLTQVALESDCPVVFGVLTTNDLAQAQERSGGKHGNKGHDAALAALEMVALYRQL